MAATRYAIINNLGATDIVVKFPDSKSRDKFSTRFHEHHESHDHEDDRIPELEFVPASAVNKHWQRTVAYEDIVNEKVSIDGYSIFDIKEYHNRSWYGAKAFYKVPTCCISLLIEVDDKLFDSENLERHELSAVFGDISAQELGELQNSMKQQGIHHEVIKLYEGKILDGWHRFRACRGLNLLRKLTFQNWDMEKDGDPKAFVLAENIARRHLTASQRAQIAVTFNERFGHGGDRSKVSNETLKTREQLAEEANVSKATVARAIAVEKKGEAEAVIAGEKTATEVLSSDEKAVIRKKTSQAAHHLWSARAQLTDDFNNRGLGEHLAFVILETEFKRRKAGKSITFINAMRRTSAETYKEMLDKIFESKTTIEVLQAETRVLQELSGDILNWKRPDWTPDHNWILPLVNESVNQSIAEDEPETPETDTDTPEPEKESDMALRRESIKCAISDWKLLHKGEGVSHVSFSMCVAAAAELTGIENGKVKSFELLRRLRTLLFNDNPDFLEKIKEVAGIEKDDLPQLEQAHDTHEIDPHRITGYKLTQIKADCLSATSAADNFVNEIAQKHDVTNDVVRHVFWLVDKDEESESDIDMVSVMWRDGSSIDFGHSEDCAASLSEIHNMVLNTLDITAQLAYLNLLNKKDNENAEHIQS